MSKGGGGGPSYSPQQMADAQMGMMREFLPLMSEWNRFDQYGPTGRSVWERDAEGKPIAQYTQLRPEVQSQLDLTNFLRTGLLGNALSQLGSRGLDLDAGSRFTPFRGDPVAERSFADFTEPYSRAYQETTRPIVDDAIRRFAGEAGRRGLDITHPSISRRFGDLTERLANRGALQALSFGQREAGRLTGDAFRRRGMAGQEHFQNWGARRQAELQPYSNLSRIMAMAPAPGLPQQSSFVPLSAAGAPQIGSWMNQANQQAAANQRAGKQSTGNLIGAGMSLLGGK